jgi:hypothetical protein
MKKLTAFALALMSVGAVSANEARSSYGGQLSLEEPQCTFVPHAFSLNWEGKDGTGGYHPNKDGSFPFTIKVEGATFNGTARFDADGKGNVTASYSASPDKDVKLNGLCVHAQISGNVFFGGSVACDARQIALPRENKGPFIFNGAVQKATFTSADGKPLLTIAFDKPSGFFVQDNRQWNGNDLSIRIPLGAGNAFKAGQTYAAVFTVSAQPSLSFTPGKPFYITAGSEWIPLKDDMDIVPGSALDFTAISGNDAPAGKYGYVVAKGGHFEFEKKPGVAQRFYGVNFCGSANYLSKEDAETMAGRLARIGYNAVRLHHYDAPLTEGSKDGTTLNPQRLAQLDNVTAACIRHGLYITTDLFVSRRIPYRAIGIDRDGIIPMDEYKQLVPIHEGAFQNLVQFSRQLLSHVNPETGRRYADEPALSWLALINEGNPGNHGSAFYKSTPEWTAAWKAWLAAKKTEDPAAFADVPDTIPDNLWNRDRQTAVFSLFLQGREQLMDKRLRAFLHDEMHCKALITDMSSWMNPACYQLPRANWFDYIDDHFYVDHPNFLEQPWRLPSRCANANPMLNPAMGAHDVAYRRLLDKPFTITEYNYAGPGRFRGVGGIATGTLAALQDWGGIWRFAWSHSDWAALHPGPMGYFNMSEDPLSLAAERASICLFLRRDLPALPRTYAIVLPAKKLETDITFSPLNQMPWTWVGWFARLGTVVADSAPAGATWSSTYPDAYKMKDEEMRKLVTPQSDAVTIDKDTGTFLLKTDCTCGGFAEKGVIQAGALTADIGGTAATVWVSSLDNQPVRSSKRLLLTHLTDIQNTGICYADSKRQVLLDWGKLPHLMRNGQASISIQTDGATAEVYALTTSGARRNKIASEVKDGVLRFKADIAADASDATFLYEITR